MDRAASLGAQSGSGAVASDRAFALTAACCRRPVNVAAVRAAAADLIDWRVFAQVAWRHRVVGLVYEALQCAGLPLPAGIAEELAGGARLIAGQSLAHAHECVRLQRLFDHAGIPVRFLKGVALAQAAYGTVTVKHARDIDLLVAPTHVPAALELLLADCYALHEPGRHLTPARLEALVAHAFQTELGGRGAKGTLELHWRLSANRRLPHNVDPFATAATVTLSGVGDVMTLRPEDEFVYLCVHGAGHSWSRLKWLADLNARLSTLDMKRIAGFYRYAEAHGAGLCAGQALLLCDRIFGSGLPDELRALLSADTRVGRLAAGAERRMRAGDPGGAPSWRPARTFRNVIHPFRLGRGPRFFVAQLREVVIGPGDPVRLPLPRALVILYPLMRLPLWLWRQWPRRAKRALQAARRG